MFYPDLKAPDIVEDALYCVFHGGEIVTDMRTNEPCLLPRDQVRFLAPEPLRQVFLGYWRNRPCFARELDPAVALDAPHYQTGNLYSIIGRVPDALFAVAGRAQQLLAWERENAFCGRCGQTMTTHAVERARHCEPCSNLVYPRIAPCIIVLVTRGPEMLLARNSNFPTQMFSTLAGFIEAGESVEECLVREVREEVGVDVGNTRYFSSQSWPFPNQLMLGFFADYEGGDIVCDEEEIAEAHWFKPGQLPNIPPAFSISGQLIRHHVKNHS